MQHIPFSGIREIFEECSHLEDEGRDIIHLEMGSPDFDTPEPIKDAAKQALEDGKVHYTSNYGISSLRREISRKLERDNDLVYDPETEVIVTTGVTEAVLVAVLTLADTGDEVLIPDTCWTYEPSIRMAGATPVRYHLDPETGFQPDRTNLESVVSDSTSLMIVNSPHNPTGSVLTEDSIAEIASFANEHDLYVLSDEIYEKIIYNASHHSPAAASDMYERTVTINGFSKAFSMTGWRLGYLAAPAELVDALIRIRQYTTTCAPSFNQYGGITALQRREELSEPMRQEFENRRELLLDRIDEIPGMSVPEPQGAFYAMPTIPAGFADGREFVMALLREAGVATVHGSVFGPDVDNRFRIAYSNSAARIDEAFDRIEEWLASR